LRSKKLSLRKREEKSMEARLSSASATTMSQTVLTGQANMAGNMHGGEIMKIMDATAAVAGQRHA